MLTLNAVRAAGASASRGIFAIQFLGSLCGIARNATAD
jgi:hypothetical protein